MKSHQQALTEIIRSLHAGTGIEPDPVQGSDMRSLAEAMAFQVNDLSGRFDRALAEVVPQAIYTAFAFQALPAKGSVGALEFNAGIPADAPIVISAGTIVTTMDGSVRVETTQEMTLEAGETTILIPAVSVTAGESSNVPGGTLTVLEGGIPGIASVTNPDAFTGGQDEESPDQQLDRFMLHLDTLEQSTLSGLRAGVLLTTDTNGDRVQDVLIRDKMHDNTIPAGEYHVHAYRKGGISSTLQALILQTLERQRASGTYPTLIATPGTPVNITLEVLTSSIGTLDDVRSAIETYFDALGYGEKFSYENLIAVTKASNPYILEITLLAPTADVTTTITGHLQLGTATLTEVLA